MKHETSTFADKTSTMYRLEKEQYHRLFQNTVTAYKKSNKETARRINCERIKCAKKAKIQDMVTLKDYHKMNFSNHTIKGPLILLNMKPEEIT